AIVLTDSNNITTEVMARSREALSQMLSNLEIYTTDNHVVNASNLDVNPLGSSGDVDHIVSMIVRCVEMAIKSAVPVKIGMGETYVRVRMGEENAYQRLIESVFNSLKVAKYTIMITIPSSVIASIMVFRLIAPFI
ncbi:MAG TPA: DUF2070 family protein, partial [Thermoplasmataceae archaeon]|nr:DUF2070 family protein [Thermoplasmataceae archaeon]